MINTSRGSRTGESASREASETVLPGVPGLLHLAGRMRLMAQLAGMELENRFADWDGTPFTADSQSHISVWRKP